jgi:carbon monoxide dehydrogenase subunit G
MKYAHEVHVAAAPDRVYRLLADTDSLVRSVPQLVGVTRAEGDRVEVEARYEGKTERGEATLQTDDEARRVTWGVEESGYHGSLAVEPDGEGSRLLLELTTPQAHDIDAEVAGTLDSVRRLLEAQL